MALYNRMILVKYILYLFKNDSAKSKTLTVPDAGKDMEQPGLLLIASSNAK